VPHHDHIISIDLWEIDVNGTPTAPNEVIVYLARMEDNVLTDAVPLAVGQTITLTLRPWVGIVPDLDNINRTELVAGDIVFVDLW
jgi:hypothetical protein